MGALLTVSILGLLGFYGCILCYVACMASILCCSGILGITSECIFCCSEILATMDFSLLHELSTRGVSQSRK